MYTPQLTIQGLTFERRNQTLFSQLNFTLDPGELVQVRGANGCGKSSLLRILAAYIQPEQGDVRWQNQCVFQHRDSYQQRLHYIGHLNGVKPLLSAQENLQLSAALCGKKNIPLKNILEKCGLLHARHTAAMHLSAGQCRRLALARLLLNPLPLWILDEPATALDAAGQELLADLLEEHLKNQGSVIMATHHQLALKATIKTIELGRGDNV